MSVQTLIDKAAQRCGTRYKLAKNLGVSANQVYDWANGTKPCSPADRARLAGFAGEDAVQELVRATLETARGDVRKEQLQQLLGKSSRAIGAALAFVVPALISLTSGPAEAASYLIRCILC
jgi:DNA-binding transcriptional regulator YdaS (Cro superfamily)